MPSLAMLKLADMARTFLDHSSRAGDRCSILVGPVNGGAVVSMEFDFGTASFVVERSEMSAKRMWKIAHQRFVGAMECFEAYLINTAHERN